MGNWTPGPWVAIRDAAHHRVVVRAGFSPLAEMWMVGQPEDQRLADARLIAAAPDLFDSLSLLLEVEEGDLTGADFRREINAAKKAAKAAIAKATQP